LEPHLEALQAFEIRSELFHLRLTRRDLLPQSRKLRLAHRDVLREPLDVALTCAQLVTEGGDLLTRGKQRAHELAACCRALSGTSVGVHTPHLVIRDQRIR